MRAAMVSVCPCVGVADLPFSAAMDMWRALGLPRPSIAEFGAGHDARCDTLQQTWLLGCFVRVWRVWVSFCLAQPMDVD